MGIRRDEKWTRGPSRAALVLLVGALAACGVAGAASARSAGAAHCAPGSQPPASGPHKACVYGPWTTHGVSGLSAIDGSYRLAKRYVHVAANGGKQSYWEYTVKITYHDPLAACPAPTPLEALPCQSPGPPQIANYGLLVKGKRSLVHVDNVAGSVPVCTADERSCTFSLRAYPYEGDPPVASGPVTFVIGVTVGELTKTAGGAAGGGDAGFEFALPANVTKRS